MSRELLKRINDLEREREDLLVLIDTLQTNLRAAASHLSDEDRNKVESVQKVERRASRKTAICNNAAEKI